MILAALLALSAAPAPEPTPAPALRLDHMWIATATGAARERAALERAGFTIAPTINRHEGQGTASATVEFENGFLELIYADDRVPVAPGAELAKQRFVARGDWRRSGESPFGVALDRTPETPAALPFETWRVTAEWMGPGGFIEMLTPRGSHAVNLAIHPLPLDEAANLRAIAGGGAGAAMFHHANGARRVTALWIVAPTAEGLPPAAAFVNGTGAVALAQGSEWLMELTLDGGAQHRGIDLRPDLPLIVRH
jgi:hypothetical protein